MARHPDATRTAGGSGPAVRNEWLLILFTGSTNLADAVVGVALPLLAVTLTDSPTLVALVATLFSLPWLLTALHIGVLVDRHDRRRLLVAAGITRLVAMAVLLGAVAGDAVTLPLLYAVALTMGTMDVLAATAGASIVPAAVPRHRWQHAAARITAVEYLANGFVGTPVGGFLVAAGFAVAVGTTGGLYLAGAVLLLSLAGRFTPARTTDRQPVTADIRAGLALVWRHRLLRTMALLIAVMAGCWTAWLALIPIYAVDVLGLDARQYGLLLTTLGAGGIVGAVLVGPANRLIGRRWSMFTDVVGSLLLVAAPALVPATEGSAVAVGAAAFAAGLGGTMWTVNARVIYQSLVPDGMLGRFTAAYRLISWGTGPIAAALAGVLATAAGYRAAFGVFTLAALALVYPYLKVVTGRALAVVGAHVAGGDDATAAADAAATRADADPSGADAVAAGTGAGGTAGTRTAGRAPDPVAG